MNWIGLPSLCLVLALLAPITASAQVPFVYPYSGYLEIDGLAVSGPVSMRFRLYDVADPATATAVWSEEWSDAEQRSCGDADCRVLVYDGEFTALLGRHVGMGTILERAERLWLAVEVRYDEGDWLPLSGTVAIQPAAYALWSTTASDLTVTRNLQVEGEVVAECPGGTCAPVTVSTELEAGEVDIDGTLRTGAAEPIGGDLSASLIAADQIVAGGDLGPATGSECNVWNGDLQAAADGELRLGPDRVMGASDGGTILDMATTSQFSGLYQPMTTAGPTTFGGPTVVEGGIDAHAGLRWGVTDIDTARPVAMYLQPPSGESFLTDESNQPISADEWFCFVGGSYVHGAVSQFAFEQQLYGAYTYVDESSYWHAHFELGGTTNGNSGVVICMQAGLAGGDDDTWFPVGGDLPNVPAMCRSESTASEETYPGCGSCVEGACCATLDTCLNDPSCACFEACINQGGSQFDCEQSCGGFNSPMSDLLACYRFSCGVACPDPD